MTIEQEEQAVIALCDRFGYGRVMQIAADAWASKDPIGALTVGACAGTVAKKQPCPWREGNNQCVSPKGHEGPHYWRQGFTGSGAPYYEHS